jgi:hypothetical protein
MRQNTLLRRTSPVAVDDRGHSYVVPLCVYPLRETAMGGGGGGQHLIKVYFNAPYVRRTYGDHAEKPVPPAPKHRNTFIQHEQILRALCHPR